jgi:hypothetical protein
VSNIFVILSNQIQSSPYVLLTLMHMHCVNVCVWEGAGGDVVQLSNFKPLLYYIFFIINLFKILYEHLNSIVVQKKSKFYV